MQRWASSPESHFIRTHPSASQCHHNKSIEKRLTACRTWAHGVLLHFCPFPFFTSQFSFHSPPPPTLSPDEWCAPSSFGLLAFGPPPIQAYRYRTDTNTCAYGRMNSSSPKPTDTIYIYIYIYISPIPGIPGPHPFYPTRFHTQTVLSPHPPIQSPHLSTISTSRSLVIRRRVSWR